MKRRRLGDLYVRGRELAPNDGEGEPVRVWMSKLNELDREAALRRANAVKARYLIEIDDEESDVFVAAYGQIRELEDRETMIRFVISDDLARIRRRVEGERATDEDTWAKDGYLQGLFDAWLGTDDEPGLVETSADNPGDPEAERVKAEIDRYQKEVTDEVDAHAERLEKDWSDVEIDFLQRRAAHELLRLRSNEAFVREYQRQQLYYAVRDATNRRQRYFATVSEVDDLDDELRTYLTGQLNSLTVENTEGKDSPPPEGSSNSSESADPPSGPETATV
jgi:hypothetical protein